MKPEIKICAGSNSARSVSEIRDGKDLWQWFKLEIRLNAFRQSIISQKQFIIINCLSADHIISQCQSNHSCKVSGCNKLYHTLSHRETSTKYSVTLTKNDANTETLNIVNALPNTGNSTPNTANLGIQEQVSIIEIPLTKQVVPVIIKNENKLVETNVLLDSGSNVTLINKDLFSKLNLSWDSKMLHIFNAISEVSKVEYQPFVLQVLFHK